MRPSPSTTSPIPSQAPRRRSLSSRERNRSDHLRARHTPRVMSPRPARAGRGDRRSAVMTKQEAAAEVRAATTRLGLTWAQLADAVGRPPAWTTSALLGQQPMTATQAVAAASLLDLGAEVVQALQLQPTRGALGAAVPVDPTIYRFYEVIQVYGPTLKAVSYTHLRAHET